MQTSAIVRHGTASKVAAPPQFLSFHLQVLQSLEFPTELNHKDGGCSVDASFWNVVRSFLQEREGLSKKIQQASSMKEIHEEALSFMEEQQQQSQTEDSTTSPPAAKRARLNAATARAYSWSIVKKESPHGSLNFSSPHRYSQQNLHARARDGLKCAGLVSKLLKKRSLSFESTIHKRSSPYLPILRQVEAQIATVEHQLQTMREDILSKRKQAMEDVLSLSAIDVAPSSDADHHDSQAKMSLLDTKLQLWNMLASDLRRLVPRSKSLAA